MTDPFQPPPGQQPGSQYEVTRMSEGFSWAAPPMPSVTPQEMRPPVPATLTAATWVWLVATALGVLALPVLLWTNIEGIAESMATGSDPMPLDEGRSVAQVFGGLALLGGLVVAAPFVVAAIKLRSGKNWTRVMLTVLGAVTLIYNIVLLVAALFADNWQAGVATVIATIGLTIAGMVLVFLPASNQFVKASPQ